MSNTILFTLHLGGPCVHLHKSLHRLVSDSPWDPALAHSPVQYIIINYKTSKRAIRNSLKQQISWYCHECSKATVWEIIIIIILDSYEGYKKDKQTW